MIQVCRLLPWTVNNYKLNELITVKELRSNVHALFRQNCHVTNPGVRPPASLLSNWRLILLPVQRLVILNQVIDMLIYKGREELEVRLQTLGTTACSQQSCLANLTDHS